MGCARRSENRALDKIDGGSYFHPSDEGLSPGGPEKKSHWVWLR
jgi:hypothetical protein